MSENVWDRQIGEPLLWYSRFVEYLTMGSSRSVRAAYLAEREKSGKLTSGSTPGSWRNAANQWEWSDRAATYDSVQSVKQLETHEQGLQDAQEIWLTRQEVHRQRAWRMAEMLLTKAEQMLEMPIVIKNSK